MALSPKLKVPPKVARVGIGLAIALVAVASLLCANILGFYATIELTPTWSYFAPPYFWLVMIGANFGGAVVPGYFSQTKKGARNLAIILGAAWGVLAGLVLWYMGLILGPVVFAGVFVGYNHIRGDRLATQ